MKLDGCVFLFFFPLLSLYNTEGLSPTQASHCSGLHIRHPTDEDTSPLYFLSLLPYPDSIPTLQPSWDEGPTLWLAEQLAVEHINARSDLLPGYRVELLKGDSGCDITQKAVSAFVRQIIYSEHNIAGVIGPGCSASATTVSSLTGHPDVSLINIHIAGSPLLVNRKVYPYSYGTLDSTEVFVETLLVLMRRNNWTKVGVLYEDSRIYYRTTLQSFERKLRDTPEYELGLSSAVYDTYIPLDDLLDTETRIIILMVGPEFLSKIFCIAYHRGLTFPVYQWLIVSRTVEEINEEPFIYEGKSYSCNGERIKAAVEGSIVIHYRLRPLNESAKTDVGLSYTEFYNSYLCRLEEFNDGRNENATLAPSFWASSYYDPVWALAMALNNSLRYFQTADSSLTDYHYGQQRATSIIQKQILALDFEGVSGRIKFSRNSGYVNRAVDIYQVDTQGSMNIVGYQNAGLIIDLADVQYINTQFDSVLVSLPNELTAFFLVLAISGFALMVTLHILMITFRKRKSVRASSVRLTHLAFIGCYSLVLALLSYTAIGTGVIDSNVQCKLYHVLHSAFSIGCTLIFGTLTARTWRLYRIFNHFLDPGNRLLTDRFLALFVLTLLLFDIIVCAAWVAIDPFTVERGKSLVVDSRGVPVLEVRIRCQQNYFFVWFGILVGFNAYWVLSSCVLAVLTRNIPQKDFKTKGIVVLVYILTIVFGIGFPLYTLAIVNSSALLEYVCLCSLLNLLLIFCIVFLFLSPLFAHLKQKLRAISR